MRRRFSVLASAIFMIAAMTVPANGATYTLSRTNDDWWPAYAWKASAPCDTYQNPQCFDPRAQSHGTVQLHASVYREVEDMSTAAYWVVRAELIVTHQGAEGYAWGEPSPTDVTISSNKATYNAARASQSEEGSGSCTSPVSVSFNAILLSFNLTPELCPGNTISKTSGSSLTLNYGSWHSKSLHKTTEWDVAFAQEVRQVAHATSSDPQFIIKYKVPNFSWYWDYSTGKAVVLKNYKTYEAWIYACDTNPCKFAQ